MHIKKPGKVLGKSIKLKNMKLTMKHGRTSPIYDLNITPMVDMLTMLVVFLLATFSATGEILFINKDIVLPPALNAVELQRAPVISVSKATIGFEGSFVVSTTDVSETTYPDWNLTPLATLLDEERESWTLAHAGTGEEFKGEVIIQADSEVPFSILKLVMATCAKAKYLNMSYAIKQISRGEANLGE
jgi:biopolymer transport protein ExbD